MSHFLVEQYRFAIQEWLRGHQNLPADDALKRLEHANSIGWAVGHLAEFDQKVWVERVFGERLPSVDRTVYVHKNTNICTRKMSPRARSSHPPYEGLGLISGSVPITWCYYKALKTIERDRVKQPFAAGGTCLRRASSCSTPSIYTAVRYWIRCMAYRAPELS